MSDVNHLLSKPLRRSLEEDGVSVRVMAPLTRWLDPEHPTSGSEGGCRLRVDELRQSDRLTAVVDALPLRPGIRVLEIGAAPGTAAKAVARRIGDGHILVIDRSAKGVARIEQNAAAEIAAELLSVRHVAAKDFELLPGEPPFDIAFAIRVEALDGRHPEAGTRARQRIAAALTPTGQLFIDGGDPLRSVELSDAAD